MEYIPCDFPLFIFASFLASFFAAYQMYKRNMIQRAINQI